METQALRLGQSRALGAASAASSTSGETGAGAEGAALALLAANSLVSTLISAAGWQGPAGSESRHLPRKQP